MTEHSACHKLRQAMADLHLAENELAGLDKYMTDEHYATRKERARMLIRSAQAVITFTVDAGIGPGLLTKGE